ncbi:DUF1642 domain-containing protein [Listeria monocytogenes]|nr:DUF1642 domain-containing protein [Listeria monocytogenes]
MKFEVGERVQVIYENELKTGAITNLYIVDALVNFDSGGKKEACIPFAYMMKLDQPEPVKVPQFVAEWYEANKNKLDSALWEVIGSLRFASPSELTPIQNFIYNSGETIETLSAMKNGYVVEEEKKYYVHVVPGEEGYLNLRTNRDGSIYYGLAGSSEVEGFQTKFTEEEIKAIDEKLWAFAVPVEEVEVSE